MSLLSSVKMSKDIKKYSLMTSYDDKQRPVVYIGFGFLPRQRVFLKKFKSDLDYHKFLAEAFLLRMSVHNKDVKKARDEYHSICGFLDEKEREWNEVYK